jgi:hypothetical protein
LHGGRRSFPTARLTLRIVTYQRIPLKQDVMSLEGDMGIAEICEARIA